MSVDVVVAVVQKVIANGEHGPFAVATIDGFAGGSVTFSLVPPVWQEKTRPEEGEHVVLDDVRKKRSGWRAYSARFYRLSDEQTERSKEMKSTEKSARETLREAGFVHITGLPVIAHDEGRYWVGVSGIHETGSLGIGLVGKPGTWGKTEDFLSLITLAGEAWISAYSPKAEELAQRLCPNGESMRCVPASEPDESFRHHDLLERLANPDWTCAGQTLLASGRFTR